MFACVPIGRVFSALHLTLAGLFVIVHISVLAHSRRLAPACLVMGVGAVTTFLGSSRCCLVLFHHGCGKRVLCTATLMSKSRKFWLYLRSFNIKER